MPKYDRALRGCTHAIHQRANFACRYCGRDGKLSFNAWLTLSWDHLFPRDTRSATPLHKGHRLHLLQHGG